MKTNREDISKKELGWLLDPNRTIRTAKETNKEDKRFKQIKLHFANLDALQRYNRHLLAKGYSNASIVNYIRLLKDLGLLIKKPYNKAIKEDIEEFIAGFNGNSETTKVTYAAIVKSFYQWLFNLPKEKYPEVVSWIKTTRKQKDLKLPEELLTEEEIIKLINSCDHPRDRALISVLYESAARISEILFLKKKHFHPDDFGGTITITKSKTKQRKLRLINSIPYLQSWLNEHPLKETNDWLFIDLASNGYGNRLGWAGFYSKLKVIAERAGIKKKIYPHLFRHSRLSELAKEYSESELKVIAGWSGDSRMAQVYIHLSEEDIGKKMLKNAGLIVEEESEKENKLKPIPCIRCHETNAATNKYCIKCGLGFSAKEIDKLLLKTKLLEQVAGDIAEEDDLINAIAKKIVKKYGSKLPKIIN